MLGEVGKLLSIHSLGVGFSVVFPKIPESFHGAASCKNQMFTSFKLVLVLRLLGPNLGRSFLFQGAAAPILVVKPALP